MWVSAPSLSRPVDGSNSHFYVWILNTYRRSSFWRSAQLFSVCQAKFISDKLYDKSLWQTARFSSVDVTFVITRQNDHLGVSVKKRKFPPFLRKRKPSTMENQGRSRVLYFLFIFSLGKLNPPYMNIITGNNVKVI